MRLEESFPASQHEVGRNCAAASVRNGFCEGPFLFKREGAEKKLVNVIESVHHLDRFTAQPPPRRRHYPSAQRKSWRRGGPATCRVCPQQAGNTGVMCNAGDVSPAHLPEFVGSWE